LLARLFAKPANIIVLDEPTNDLDSETLEMLEAKLVEYEGTILLVSHDRAFLNNVVTSTIVFEPQGVREYVGGYDDWLRQRPEASEDSLLQLKKTMKEQPKLSSAKPAKEKLSYKHQRELDNLPTTIERLEAKVDLLQQAMSDPDFFQRPGEQIAVDQKKLKEQEIKLEDAYARWEELA